MRPGSIRVPAFIVDDFRDHQAGLRGSTRRNSARGYGGESGLSEITEPVVGSSLERHGFDQARRNKIKIAEPEIISRIEGSLSHQQHGLRLFPPRSARRL